jgi:hypothetical protein
MSMSMRNDGRTVTSEMAEPSQYEDVGDLNTAWHSKQPLMVTDS